jgi:hypothetical protein
MWVAGFFPLPFSTAQGEGRELAERRGSNLRSAVFLSSNKPERGKLLPPYIDVSRASSRRLTRLTESIDWGAVNYFGARNFSISSAG